MKFNNMAGMLVAGTLLGVSAYSVSTCPAQVQAATSYQVKLTKKTYVYNSKGKKTKASYNKNKVVTAYRVRKIRGKYYYDLGKGMYIRTANAKKYYYRTYHQTKKIIRTIKLYQPKGIKTVKQNAYVKRTVTQNTKTWKKTYGKWSTSSWKAYLTPAVAGYTASTEQVNKEVVYTWTKNKTVKVKYKKNKKKKATTTSAPAKQTSSSQEPSSMSSGKSETSTKSTSSKNNSSSAKNSSSTKNDSMTTINHWDKKKEQLAIQGCLQVINDLRKQAGRPPLKLNTQFQDILNQRAYEKAKLFMDTYTLNHDGWREANNQIKQRDPSIKSVGENLSNGVVELYATDDEIVKQLVNDFLNAYQLEKNDYEAMVIKHTRTKITNPYWTFGHYTSLILDKPETGVNADTPTAEFVDSNNTEVAIGINVYEEPQPGSLTSASYGIVVDSIERK